MRERLTGTVPVDSVQDDWAGDDGINVDIGLPQSCHDHSQSPHPPLISVKLTCGRNQSGVEDWGTEGKCRVPAHTSSYTQK